MTMIWTGYKTGWLVERRNGRLIFTYKRFHQGVWIKGKRIVLPPDLAKRVEIVK